MQRKGVEKTTKKNVALTLDVYEKLDKTAKRHTQTFNDSVSTLLDFHERLPAIKSLIKGLFSEILNSCAGNTKRTLQVKQRRAEALKLLEVQ